MKQSHLFVHLPRLKLTNHWLLMHNVQTENVSEHSLQVAIAAYTLATIKSRKFGGNANVERTVLLAMYHDTSEVLTGGLPTPVKYFNSQIAQECRAIEKIVQQKLVDMVLEELRDIFTSLVSEYAHSDKERSLVKQANALCAYLKCLEGLAVGNNGFLLVKARLKATSEARRSQEMDYFTEVFVPSFYLSLDEISQDSPLQAVRVCVTSDSKRRMQHRALAETETASGSSPYKPPSR